MVRCRWVQSLTILRPRCLLPLLPRSLAVWISGLVQTLLYADFFYYYLLCLKDNKKLSLPA